MPLPDDAPDYSTPWSRLATQPTLLRDAAKDLYYYRRPKPTEWHFCLSAWLRAARALIPGATDEAAYASIRGPIEAALARGNTLVCALNVLSDDGEDDLAGFVCAERKPDVLHWVYVKAPFRGLGLGLTLLRRALPDYGYGDTVCSAWPPRVRRYAEDFKLTHDPTALTRKP
jgi:GNAT superfamily N-acetyltransferase